jgi:predicted O-methyltransferase YrrM
VARNNHIGRSILRELKLVGPRVADTVRHPSQSWIIHHPVLAARHMLALLKATVEGTRDWPRLKREWHALSGLDEAIETAMVDLRPTYLEYVSTVSQWEWAISLEAAAALMACCRLLRPTAMLDTGSGYSSYVLRRYADEVPQAHVTSVDHDPMWLGKTREYLASHGLPGSDTLTWDEFHGLGPREFDLVLHDLGSEEDRVRTLDYVLGSVRPGGVVLLDDAQMTIYGPYARRRLAAKSFRCYSLRALTREHRYSRYTMLGWLAPLSIALTP